MIQTIISRMSQNSFSLKGWSITLVAGIFALAAKDANLTVGLISYIPIIVFWFLDSYYLQMERKYRSLYNNLITNKRVETDFDLNPPRAAWKEKTYYIQNVISLAETPFYCVLASLVAIVICIIQKGEF